MAWIAALGDMILRISPIESGVELRLLHQKEENVISTYPTMVQATQSVAMGITGDDRIDGNPLRPMSAFKWISI